MDDIELSKLCDLVRRVAQRREVIDLCSEVEKRLAEKTLPEPKKYERREQMAKYMREVYRPRLKTKQKPTKAAPVVPAKQIIASSDKASKLEALRKTLGGNLVETEEPNPFE